MVEVVNKTKRKICKKSIARLGNWLVSNGKSGNWEISVAIIGNRRMRTLNREYRGIDRSTDILTFSEGNFGKIKLGEIFVCPEEIDKDSRYGFISDIKKKDRLYFIIIHGWLHLLGYDDEKEKDRLKMIDLGYGLMEKAKKNGII